MRDLFWLTIQSIVWMTWQKGTVKERIAWEIWSREKGEEKGRRWTLLASVSSELSSPTRTCLATASQLYLIYNPVTTPKHHLSQDEALEAYLDIKSNSVASKMSSLKTKAKTKIKMHCFLILLIFDNLYFRLSVIIITVIQYLTLYYIYAS